MERKSNHTSTFTRFASFKSILSIKQQPKLNRNVCFVLDVLVCTRTHDLRLNDPMKSNSTITSISIHNERFCVHTHNIERLYNNNNCKRRFLFNFFFFFCIPPVD